MSRFLKAICLVGLIGVMGAMTTWAGGPPNPTPSDSQGNTAGGSDALINNTSNNLQNTAFGDQALFDNNFGCRALVGTYGGYNSAFGYQAAFGNSGGSYNTAVGNLALYNSGCDQY